MFADVHPTPCYLQRSATDINKTVPAVGPAESGTITTLDKRTRLVLDNKGVSYRAVSNLDGILRLSRGFGCTKAFAEELLAEAFTTRGVLYKIKTAITTLLTRANSDLVSMLPGHTSTWGKWIEVLLFSSPMQSHVRKVKDELCREGEWESLANDTSYKLCLTIIGQNAFNTPEAERDAPIAYDEAAHGIASVKGNTGALAGLRLVYSEGSTCIVEALTSLLTPAHLATVVHVCVLMTHRLHFVEVCNRSAVTFN